MNSNTIIIHENPKVKWKSGNGRNEPVNGHIEPVNGNLNKKAFQ